MNQLMRSSRRFLSRLFTFLAVPLGAVFLFTGCATVSESTNSACSLFDVPPDIADAAKHDSVIASFASAFTGKTIFLDPGHGGSDRKNKSPNGLVTEADINLKVGLYLREMLVKAGAKVIMSRETDQTVELKQRPLMANNSGAQYFISIHHNAPGKPSDRFTNYTSTYYHATEEDYEHHPSNRDMAKFVNRDLAFNTGRPAGLASFDGTISDYLIYPGDGFAVLRTINMPAILVECSFFTNLNEEIRLADTLYNKMEAWGIFKGLGKYFRAPVPALNLKSNTIKSGKKTLEIAVNSKQPVEPWNIRAFANKEPLPVEKIKFANNVITLDLGDAFKRETEVKVIVTNKAGLSNLPFIINLTPEAN
ncbi:MAG: N-acetylmuramoyl-L-alanine amidase [Chlorobiota bacterium]|nr:MAG: N-acetylmuramoyl-L-alanine amidase [Chlorobiota bacterium]